MCQRVFRHCSFFVFVVVVVAVVVVACLVVLLLLLLTANCCFNVLKINKFLVTIFGVTCLHMLFV